NSLGRVKEKRIFDMVLSVGTGFFVNSGNRVNPETNINGKYNTFAPSINLGLLNKFRLSDGWDLGIEFKGGWVSNLFDGQIYNGEKYSEGDIVASIGLTIIYKFKPRRNTAYTPTYYKDETEIKDCLDKYNKLKSEQEVLLAEKERIIDVNTELSSENRRLRDSINNAKPLVKKLSTTIKKDVITVIEYSIGSSLLTASDRAKLKQAAEIIKSHPDYTYEVCGYADNTTGSKEINVRLRNARANRAIDQLLHYGVNRNQILKSTNDGQLPGTSTRAIVVQQVECD
ncbi:MAG: OmpA family protein, partial [Bacteroidales bacterium]